MLEIVQFEEVTQIRMCPSAQGRLRYWVSAYLIDGLLIDTGSAYVATSLLKYLTAQKLDAVVNTHHHEDHIGANRLLQDAFDIPLYAHPLAIPLIERPAALSAYRKRLWGVPEPSFPQPIQREIHTRNHSFEVIDAPGHCPGHVCLVERDKGWVFSGDLYISQTPRTAGPENDIGQMLASMKKLCELPMERLILFTSLRTIEKKGRERLLRCMEWYQELASRASEMRRQGRTIDEIVQALFGGESIFAGLTAGLYTSQRLVSQLLDYWPNGGAG
jgi:glyoxylase-like metal-dependent hydrolase (beta-lactamase superfamily II)